ncbi:afadin-and alpha-actinin-binding protein [Caerostris darwini]|uniref:Afadin-and alpha-actinin-binding protein n=1 Tax=Caerostris darwini TaxID=1538125 RepID=A0AAV4PJ50_9ARAC|nr:afadin-and alpha-actinin-binding protein [Caerostris darwini]
MENNFSSEINDFCSSENIDECLEHISQELSALGYPSICSNSRTCEYAVNCDIVRLLNATFDLIRSYREHAHIKDELESRNHRLFSDLNALIKKNAQLKENLEQAENKQKSALEKERQVKEKNNRLLQAIKSEKEEMKKLSSQLLQQKNTYQHEIRKYENSINQLKAKLNQMIADKNPDKKVANISPSSLLQRNSKQRGKWKTGSVAKTCMEEMYSSVISSYENRCQAMTKEILDYRQSLECIQQEVIATNSSLGGTSGDLLSLLPLSVYWNRNNLQKSLEGRFKFLLCRLQNTVTLKMENNPEKGANEKKLSLCDKNVKDSKSSEEAVSCRKVEEIGTSSESLDLEAQRELLESEKENLKKEKLEISEALAFIEKEKADLELQKLETVKLALKQESPKIQWHENLNMVPSFSVVTTKEGITAVPSAEDLKQCLNSPYQHVESLAPLWKSINLDSAKERKSRSELTVQNPQHISPLPTAIVEPPKDLVAESSHLPKWAIAAMASPTLSVISPEETSIHETSVITNTGEGQQELSNVSSTEQNLDLLKAVMEDIEKRRNQSPM